MKTRIERMIQGVQARSAAAPLGLTVTLSPSSVAKRHVSRGCQKRSRMIIEKIEAIAPAMSTTQGPW